MRDDIVIDDPDVAVEVVIAEGIRTQSPLATTYRAEVSKWVVGDGPADLLVTGFGGVLPDGQAVFPDLSQPLVPGHTYLLLLSEDNGEYWYAKRTSFDLTDGYVEFRDMPSDEFIDYVAYVAREVADWPICPFHPGDRVESERFGQGLVTSCKDLGGDYEVTVSFNGEVGPQGFLLSEERLEEIDRSEVLD
jgi:hypothetical protein